MQEMITDQEENIKKKEGERDSVRDREKRSQLNDQIKRLKKALMEDVVKYSSTIKKWKKEDQKHEKGYEADNEEGFGGFIKRKKRRRRIRRKKRTKRRRSSRHRRSKKRRTRRRRKTKRRRGGTLGKPATLHQFKGGRATRFHSPNSCNDGRNEQYNSFFAVQYQNDVIIT